MTNYGPNAYNEMYIKDYYSYENHLTIPYWRLFRKVTDIAIREPISSVLEVGCGNGVMGKMLINAGLSYIGFDFNEIAIEQARKRNGDGKHFVADATDPASYSFGYDGIICCEVLEHIEKDLQAIGLWKPGSTCICSVPNFDYETHVRFFRAETEIEERYGRLLDIQRIERLPKSPIAGLTWREYFRKLRWSRNDPKKLLGMMGIKGFDWYSGWFVFVAKRR